MRTPGHKTVCGRLFRNEMDSDNATSAQPQTSQWGRLAEILGEVRFLWCLLNRQTVYAAALGAIRLFCASGSSAE
ncbi:MAG: hypothetical protein WCD89_12800 [Anaerocolumna sp.]